jgi:hypothetical protein
MGGLTPSSTYRRTRGQVRPGVRSYRSHGAGGWGGMRPHLTAAVHHEVQLRPDHAARGPLRLLHLQAPVQRAEAQGDEHAVQQAARRRLRTRAGALCRRRRGRTSARAVLQGSTAPVPHIAPRVYRSASVWMRCWFRPRTSTYGRKHRGKTGSRPHAVSRAQGPAPVWIRWWSRPRTSRSCERGGGTARACMRVCARVHLCVCARSCVRGRGRGRGRERQRQRKRDWQRESQREGEGDA